MTLDLLVVLPFHALGEHKMVSLCLLYREGSRWEYTRGRVLVS
jgi:hypothetical protein